MSANFENSSASLIEVDANEYLFDNNVKLESPLISCNSYEVEINHRKGKVSDLQNSSHAYL